MEKEGDPLVGGGGMGARGGQQEPHGESATKASPQSLLEVVLLCAAL